MWIPEPVILDWLRTRYRYDPETGDVFSQNDQIAKGTEFRGYLVMRIANKGLGVRKTIRVHRLAYFLHTNEWPTLQIDHVNRNTLDNRAVNLRLATNTENARNKRKPVTARTSRCKGVSWHTPSSRWRAAITVNGHCKHIGLYNTEDEAALAYQEEAKRHFGAFARVD